MRVRRATLPTSYESDLRSHFLNMCVQMIVLGSTLAFHMPAFAQTDQGATSHKVTHNSPVLAGKSSSANSIQASRQESLLPTPPAAALSAGYDRLVFIDNFSSIKTIDVGATNKPGYKWYATQWFGGGVTPQQNISVDDSVLTLGGSAPGAAAIETAIASQNPPYYAGTVFDHGAYFEASMAFDPALGVNGNSWPAFWALSIEHIYDSVYQPAEQWPGQVKGYAHFPELDFMEACCGGKHSYAGQKLYYGTIHDWSGVIHNNAWENNAWRNIQNGNNGFVVGPVDWNQFHTYGCLWVPASNGKPGYAQWFFDNRPGPIIYWKGSIGNPPLPGQGPPGSASVFTPSTPDQAAPTYAIIDQQHLAVVLDTDPNWPMRVAWVKVWQKQPRR